MTERKGGLGRGLAALIPSAPPEDGAAAPAAESSSTASKTTTAKTSTAKAPAAQSESAPPAEPSGEVAGAVYREVPIDAITTNPKQPRQVFDEEALTELSHSIREFGLLQPIVLRTLPDEKFELVMGERRWRAAKQAGLDTLPAIVRGTADDAMLRDALLENIHRVQLNPLEEAAAYQQLLDEFDVTHDQLASRIGRSRPVISNTIRLLKLPLPVQRRVAAGVLSAGHARALLSLEDPDIVDDLAARIVAEGLSVRATEEAVMLAKSGPKRPQKAPPKKIEVPRAGEIADDLSDRFDTRVKVDVGRKKGKITIEFGSADDLDRLLGLISPKETK
ncbi:ParB/RepB/Spo0J family partition protein [Sciscionella sediminilitoris]|uniref:ParB/RepB/Spo0J family partition protein n=1 Tax=Sciscionella sediminilitoris TaxID=1445613 RepID=UPI0004DF0902|nr:ParB/RepB/Spo0J family partition protein [Sciscionella sp. SE31]